MVRYFGPYIYKRGLMEGFLTKDLKYSYYFVKSKKTNKTKLNGW